MNNLESVANRESISEFSIETMTDIVHPEDVDKVKKTLKRHINGET